MSGVFETIDGILLKSRSLAQLHVQKQAAVAEHQAEQVAHDGHDRYALLFVGITFPHDLAELIPLEKFPDSCRNVLPIFIIKCYTFHCADPFCMCLVIVWQLHFNTRWACTFLFSITAEKLRFQRCEV